MSRPLPHLVHQDDAVGGVGIVDQLESSELPAQRADVPVAPSEGDALEAGRAMGALVADPKADAQPLRIMPPGDAQDQAISAELDRR